MKGEARRLEIWQAHRARLIESVTPMLGDRTSAEDVVQDAWLRFSRPEREDGQPAQQHPVGYLYRIVRNLAIDLIRRKGLERKHATAADPSAVEVVADPQPSPETQAMDRDALARVAARLETLPERTRIAFEMYNFGNHTLQQVANHLGISVGMAHHLVKQAVACCMAAIADE